MRLVSVVLPAFTPLVIVLECGGDLVQAEYYSLQSAI